MTPDVIRAIVEACQKLNLNYSHLVSAALAAYVVLLTRYYRQVIKDYQEDRVLLERLAAAVERCTEQIERLSNEIRWFSRGGER